MASYTELIACLARLSGGSVQSVRSAWRDLAVGGQVSPGRSSSGGSQVTPRDAASLLIRVAVCGGAGKFESYVAFSRARPFDGTFEDEAGAQMNQPVWRLPPALPLASSLEDLPSDHTLLDLLARFIADARLGGFRGSHGGEITFDFYLTGAPIVAVTYRAAAPVRLQQRVLYEVDDPLEADAPLTRGAVADFRRRVRFSHTSIALLGALLADTYRRPEDA